MNIWSQPRASGENQRTGHSPDFLLWMLLFVEAKCTIRGCIKTPTSLGQSPSVSEWGYVPSIGQLGFQSQNVAKVMEFVGGEMVHWAG
ncbi:cryptochrome DASH, chloroplastic/mitochondrial-like [Carya illinoinensis]|uniref:cryptochrome DASH, chloroplastic/mitochondrial-like n=1 Tax=Carya illinoinensis TaxID=32201 RepID=UPI001C719689|nr:cryptochrome DASH, chloroplastic/mitochondrial-like [Carya illinoinensis]